MQPGVSYRQTVTNMNQYSSNISILSPFYLLYANNPCHKVRLEKLMVAPIAIIFPTYYKTLKHITVFTRASHWTLF
jgi:hypothetical protein